MSSGAGRGLLAVILALHVATAAAESEHSVLFDFEAPGLGASWSAQGEIDVSRRPLPEAGGAEGAGPTGSGVAIAAGAGSQFVTKPGEVGFDWSDLEEIEFWAYRSPAEAEARKAVTLELRLIEGDGRALFWRKVVLDHAGWRRVSVPLRFCRWGAGRIPRWDRVSRLSFYFRDPADLMIDAIGVVDDPYGPGTNISLEELGSIAFPDTVPADVRVLTRDDMQVLTDCADLDLELLEIHLAGVRAAVRRELPFLGEPNVPPRLLVFAEEADYRAFAPRFARGFASDLNAPTTDGFTFLGHATGFWKESFGTLRPTYTHEFVHSLIAHSARLQNRGEWLQEGLANRYQLEFHPQQGLNEIVRRGIENARWRLPLERLCDGASIPGNRYWQAVTVVELLLRSPKYEANFASLVAAFATAGSTDLGPHLEPVLGVTWSELTVDWLAFCRATYPPED